LSLPGLFVDQTSADFKKQIDVNYYGTVYVLHVLRLSRFLATAKLTVFSKAAAKMMIASKVPGKLVIVSSAAGLLSFAGKKISPF
jgi:NAD(P)-dependent dehydrogenase (short-subunit alcohol dehydrogenase family)